MLIHAGIAAAAIAAVLTVGCTPSPSAVAAVVKDKVYSVTPDAMKVKAGMVLGEVTELKVLERVEEGSGKVSVPAKLTGKLVLKNTSAEQSVRLLGGKIVYLDMQGKPIALEDNRTAPVLRMTTAYGAADRLDPGQEMKQDIEAEFPVEALKAKALKEFRIELTYIPTPFREENLSFAVSIGGQ